MKNVASIKLYCVPYAGGSATVYYRWKKYLDADIELKPLELAGHGSRIGEPLYSDRAQAVDDFFGKMKDTIAYSPYALFGHSLGGMICYDLAQKIAAENFPPPRHIFISGKGAPHVYRTDKRIFHLMDERMFRDELLDMGGTPPELFDDPELELTFLPVLKNDMRLAETNTGEGELFRPLDTDMTIFSGLEDRITPEECEPWKEHTTGCCKIYYFKGGHFFIHEEWQQIARLANDILRSDFPADRRHQGPGDERRVFR